MKIALSLSTLLLFASIFQASQAEPLTLEDVNSLRQVTAARMSSGGGNLPQRIDVLER